MKNVFSDQNWLVNPSLLNKFTPDEYSQKLLSYQKRHLNNLLSLERMSRLIDATYINSENYTLLELFSQTRNHIWSIQTKGNSISERNLQKAYLSHLISLYEDKDNTMKMELSDIKSLVYGQLLELKSYLKMISNQVTHKETKYHILESLNSIEKTLENKSK